MIFIYVFGVFFQQLGHLTGSTAAAQHGGLPANFSTFLYLSPLLAQCTVTLGRVQDSLTEQLVTRPLLTPTLQVSLLN